MSKRVRPLHFTLVLVGLLFFCNPYFAIVDVLPDFIGCALILLGTRRAARINKQMDESRAVLTKLLAYGAVKDLCVMLVFMMFTGNERPLALLTVSFLNAIASFYLTYRALYALFDGFYSLAVLHDCEALYGNCTRPSLLRRFFILLRRLDARVRRYEYVPRPVTEYCRTEKVWRASVIFLAARELLGALPEFAALTTTTYIDSQIVHLYDHIGVMRGFSVMLVLFFSVWWAVKVIGFFAALSREKEFRMRLGVADRAFVESHPHLPIQQRFALSFLLISIGTFFLCDFYLDARNVIPDWIGIVFLLGGVLCLKVSLLRRALLSLFTLAFGTLAVISTRYTYYFHLNHTAVEISKTEAAALAYRNMWVSSFAEFLLFLAFLIALLLVLRGIIRDWAGYLPTHTDLEFEKRRRASFIEEFDGDLIRVFVFGFISGLFSFLFDYIQEIPDHRIYRLLEFLWGIDLLFGIVFGVLLAATLGSIYREIQYRFCYSNE